MIILASNSPRRQELLKLICEDFLVEASDIDEILQEGLSIEKALENLAYNKALPIFKKHMEDIVIGADTIVFFKDQILGKPKSRDNAIEILQLLSNNVHHVITGISIISKEASINFNVVTEVEFYPLTSEDIISYVDECSPYDKAGAYAIQDKAAVFVKGIKGCYYNVMGFPVARINRELNNIIKLRKA